MPVVGMVIKTIDARRFEEIEGGGVKVNNQTNLKDMKEQELPALGKNKKGISINFEFKADYENEKNKKVAEIIVGGDVLYIDDDQDKVMKLWKKEKKIEEEVNLQVMNAVLRRCLTKAIALSEDLQLPPPIPMPFAARKKEESRYIG